MRTDAGARQRLNIGCGQTPTERWQNYDNSPSVRLSTIPILPRLLRKLALVENGQWPFIQFAREHQIRYADATKRLPVQDASVDVLYSSHMLEHLDRSEAAMFLSEALRVLRPGGIIRIAVPDIQKLAARYIESGDADRFTEATHLFVSLGRARSRNDCGHLVVGLRNHQWMYDGKSLARLLTQQGFMNAAVMPPGRTRIDAHEPLDLQERRSESVHVEAEKPAA